MSKNISPEAAISAAESQGWVKVRPGVYLSSQESIIADQEDWLVDGSKFYDFTKAPFWLTTDSGADPQPIYDLLDFCSMVDKDE